LGLSNAAGDTTNRSGHGARRNPSLSSGALHTSDNPGNGSGSPGASLLGDRGGRLTHTADKLTTRRARHLGSVGHHGSQCHCRDKGRGCIDRIFGFGKVQHFVKRFKLVGSVCQQPPGDVGNSPDCLRLRNWNHAGDRTNHPRRLTHTPPDALSNPPDAPPDALSNPTQPPEKLIGVFGF
jgi:hypothetical protein